MLINTKLCSKLNFTPQTSQTQTLKVILSFAAFSQTTVFSSIVSSMQKFLILVAFIVSCVSSFRFHGSSLSRSLITPVSFRNSNLGSRIQHVLYVASETSESEVIPEVSKSEQVIEAAPETKKVEEWRDPMAVAAEGKSPFADLFPGGTLCDYLPHSWTSDIYLTLILFLSTKRHHRWEHLGLLHLWLHRIPVHRLRANYGNELRCYASPIIAVMKTSGIDATIDLPFIKFICK